MHTNVVKIAEFAGLIGVSERSVHDLLRRGVIAKSARGEIELRQIGAYCEHLRTLHRGGASGPTPIVEERARLVKAQADLAEAKVEVMRNDLLPAADVQRRWADLLRSVRGAVLAVPSRVRARLPHLPAPDVEVIADEIRAALTEASGHE